MTNRKQCYFCKATIDVTPSIIRSSSSLGERWVCPECGRGNFFETNIDYQKKLELDNEKSFRKLEDLKMPPPTRRLRELMKRSQIGGKTNVQLRNVKRQQKKVYTGGEYWKNFVPPYNRW